MVLFRVLAKTFRKTELHNIRTSWEFSQISQTVIIKIIVVMLGNHKFSTRWLSKMLKGLHKIQRIASISFDILWRYQKDWDEFLNHIIPVTGDKTWISLANTETKEQSKLW
jgi:hypothetical protein